MDITQVSIIHHAGIVLVVLWLLAEFNWCHPLAYFLSLVYLYLVHERYIMRLRKRVQFEEKKQANQRRVLSDSETVRWLNHTVEKIWPICMEQIASQKILLPIIPWFLQKYKPWTAKKAVVQHLYMGRNPPVFTDMRVLRHSNDDDHLVLELGMNFLTADDFSAILAVKLRKRLGFGMWAKMHLTGMHVEGKILIGVKFLRDWPYLGRLRVCFVEPPYFQMTVKPIFNHGLDVTELPGIAGWLDKLLSIAFEQTLVEPNMLVVDMEKFAASSPEGWFSMDEREPVAYARVEVIEASNMKPSDLNGLADPYVKGQIGSYRFRTKIQKKTLTPKWQEEFKIPIVTWESPNMLVLEVRDKDHFVDDILGDCSVNISDYRNGQRHDMWLPLQNISMGRVHLALTILEEIETKVDDEQLHDWESFNAEDKRASFAAEAPRKASFSSVLSDKSLRVADNLEPINIEGQNQTGIWVHHPGSDVSQSWEPRKGNNRRLDTRILGESRDSAASPSFATSGSLTNNSSSTDDVPEDNRPMKTVRRGLKKLSSVFHRSPKEGPSNSFAEDFGSLHVNVKAENTKHIGVKFLPGEEREVEGEELAGQKAIRVSNDGDSSTGESGLDSPSREKMRDRAKRLFRNAEKSARSLRNVLSRKGSSTRSDDFNVSKAGGDSSSGDEDDSLLPSKVEKVPVCSDDVADDIGGVKFPNSLDHVVVHSAELETPKHAKSPLSVVSPRAGEVWNEDTGLVSAPTPKPKLVEANLEQQS